MNARVFIPPSTVRPPEHPSEPRLDADIPAGRGAMACLAWGRAGNGTLPPEAAEFAAGDVIAVPVLNVAIALDEIYRGIELLPQDAFPHG